MGSRGLSALGQLAKLGRRDQLAALRKELRRVRGRRDVVEGQWHRLGVELDVLNAECRELIAAIAAHENASVPA